MPRQQLVRGPAIGHVGGGAVGDHHEASAAQDMEDDASADGFFFKNGKNLGWVDIWCIWKMKCIWNMNDSTYM